MVVIPRKVELHWPATSVKLTLVLNEVTVNQQVARPDIAFARVNTPAELARHPHLRRITIGTPSGPVSYPAPAEQRSAARHYGPVPAIGEHTAKVRAEFMAATVNAK
jgi:formyl-CoA transferase